MNKRHNQPDRLGPPDRLGLARDLVVASLLLALPAGALELISAEEKAERELAKQRQAQPVLECEPKRLQESVKQDKTISLRLTIRNAGGQTLSWSVKSAPIWIRPEPRSGELGFKESKAVALVIDPAALAPGTAQDEILIEAPGAEGSPLAIAVSVEVLPGETPTVRLQPDFTAGADRSAAPQPPAGGGPRVFGVRGGVMIPGSAKKQDFGQVVAFGLFWRPRKEGSRFSYELELSLGQTESDSGIEESTLIAGQAGLLWHLKESESFLVYGLGGLALVTEQFDDQELGSDSSLGSRLDLGLGVTAGRLDGRLTYSLLLGSENVDSAIGLSAGLLF